MLLQIYAPESLNAALGFARKMERPGQQAGRGDVLRRGQLERVYLARNAKVLDRRRDVLRWGRGPGTSWRGNEVAVSGGDTQIVIGS